MDKEYQDFVLKVHQDAITSCMGTDCILVFSSTYLRRIYDNRPSDTGPSAQETVPTPVPVSTATQEIIAAPTIVDRNTLILDALIRYRVNRDHGFRCKGLFTLNQIYLLNMIYYDEEVMEHPKASIILRGLTNTQINRWLGRRQHGVTAIQQKKLIKMADEIGIPAPTIDRIKKRVSK
jgi:hypothetical protein